jgi:hypothetical protein
MIDNFDEIITNKDKEIKIKDGEIKLLKKEVRKQKILKVIGYAAAIILPILTLLAVG